MRRTTLLIALLPLVAQASGTLMIQPQPDSSIRFMAQGPTGSGSEDVLGFQQPASGRMTVTVSPSGMSRCESGDIVLDNLRFSFTNLLDNSKVLCGMPVTFDAPGKDREVPLKVAVSQFSHPVVAGIGSQKQALLPAGSVSAVAEGGRGQQYPLYLDLSVVQQPIEVLAATFSRPSLYLGSVGEMNDAAADVQLRVSKNAQASNEAIGYTLSFESTQQLNNQYRMRASATERMVPYQILAGGREVLPDSARRGTVPAGVGTADVVDIQFKLSGKQTRGLAAGVSLQDTVTAVITPDS
ncbi:hypothetical protein BTJ39_03255 [Izhakiella australiensis]|uniref:Fimbrial-type adhesion domain-containing protein n=1 Tax=Izhakiella australiensis TaxID=1926881 RepID=A0A1S8YSX5_9GAMM|nr:hypothetical protein [Izhakiella australiensis]OON42180.1 hypothetical protein BTJ39_03255 [Izhakiella australiensis]